jgi:disulfide bond formation protein DsbB
MTGRVRAALFAAWLVALVATLGSLFFAEVMGLPPCTLCWYQRILMFPLPVLLAVGIVRRDPGVTAYAAPLAAAGLAVAIYHNLLAAGLVSERLAPCTGDVSCATQPVTWLGVVTIPLLALAAFAAILGCLAAARRAAGRGLG